jgi:hydrogenase/urease accessory protein HupE
MRKHINLFVKVAALSLALLGSSLALAHAGHGEPHGPGAHTSDFMAYVIGFIAATAFVNFGSMGVAKFIKGRSSNARSLVLGALCTASAFVFIYWFTQV